MTAAFTQKKLLGLSPCDAGLAGVSGLLLTASFPKLGWDFLAWIALWLLFCALKGKSPQVGF
ncbi:MAG: hypothetical protein SWE60_26260, partial [Thermodesulfobacteriota bacterium]|nr:hypothetical protein [Thermodesulfobacteriota bacterium]